MSSPLKDRRVLLPLVVAALLVGSLLPHRYAWPGRMVRNIATTTLSPISAPMHRIASAFRQTDAAPEAENAELLRRRLDELAVELKQKQRQVMQLQAEMAMLQRYKQWFGDSYALPQAIVTAQAADPSGATMSINLGARDGLRLGMIAVEGANLVGRIVEVGQTTAVVEPITAPDSLLEVIFAPPPTATDPPPRRERRVLLRAVGRSRLVADDVPADLPVEVGDYAHLLDQGGPASWPDVAQYRVVGVVHSVIDNPDDALRKRIVVHTFWSPFHLRALTVVVPRDPSSGAGGDGAAMSEVGG